MYKIPYQVKINVIIYKTKQVVKIDKLDKIKSWFDGICIAGQLEGRNYTTILEKNKLSILSKGTVLAEVKSNQDKFTGTFNIFSAGSNHYSLPLDFSNEKELKEFFTNLLLEVNLDE